MNPHPSPQPVLAQPERTIYVHHFNYLIDNVEEDIIVYIEKYIEIMGLTPDIMKFKDKNLIYVKIQTDKKTIHNIDNLKELSNYGINFKLSSQQLDQNSVFCLGIPANIIKNKKEKLISDINKNHPELKVLDVYVLPVKTKEQKITSIKISFATQLMVNKVMGQGIKIMEHKITPSNINRANILGSPQCMRCFAYTHSTKLCNNIQKCLHCSEGHVFKNYPNKSKNPTSANCTGGQKPFSNRCPTRKQYLIIPKTDLVRFRY